MLAGAILEYAFEKVNDKAEANRRRRKVRVLFMLVVGLTLIIAFGLSLPLFLSP
jgi:predicted nucleic acid-binding Zn ribbon protein